MKTLLSICAAAQPMRRRPGRVATPLVMGLLSAAAVIGACSPSSNQSSPEADGGACQTPAAENLFPAYTFGATPPAAGGTAGFVGGDGGEDDAGDGAPIGPGGPGGGDGGGPGGGDGDGPSSNPPPITADDGGVPAPLLTRFPNGSGRGANEIMPGVNTQAFRNSAIGKNGRTCATCHADEQQWSTPLGDVQGRFSTGVDPGGQQFSANDGAASNDDLDPIFRTVDGTNSPNADVSTPAARTSAYSMLLARSVIRVGRPVPKGADFALVSADDPYQFASQSELSLFRRIPLMANLRFNTTVMWDDRETAACATLTDDLRQQATDATTTHAQGPTPSSSDASGIVQAELGIYFAQYVDNQAGQLDQDGGRGGAWYLAQVAFHKGVNSFDQTDPQGHPYDPAVFSLYQAWSGRSGNAQQTARAQIAAGEQVFNSKQFTITGVSGFNDTLGRSSVTATCGACHNTPNVGTNSQGWLMDLGISDAANRTPDLPLYTFKQNGTGSVLKTSDPGQALTTGKWADMDRFKVPNLRGLAGRAPYFHNGGAASLDDVVKYHDRRFGIGLTAAEEAALVAFLGAL